jgi:hypothetical protein
MGQMLVLLSRLDLLLLREQKRPRYRDVESKARATR